MCHALYDSHYLTLAIEVSTVPQNSKTFLKAFCDSR